MSADSSSALPMPIVDGVTPATGPRVVANGAVVADVEVETPKDRLPPSPPLTPVASLASLRQKASATAAAGTSKETITPGVAGPSTSMRMGEMRDEDFGHASTHDGVGNEAMGVGVDEDEGGGNDRAAGLESYTIDDSSYTSSRRPAEIVHPLSSPPATATSLQDGLDTETYESSFAASGPTPPPDGISGHYGASGGHTDISGQQQHVDMDQTQAQTVTHTSSTAHPAPDTPLSEEPSSPSSPMPREPVMHEETLASRGVPMPWEYIEPPRDSSLEERERRMRKTSRRSLEGAKDVVVKDGKKYRIPRSSYYFGPPPETAAYGTDPVGHIGVHHPREIVRIERDYSGGELAQFSPAYPLELEGRITPTQFMETVNAINELLIDAHNLRWSFVDNALAYFTLYISRLFIASHYDKRMNSLEKLVAGLNKQLYNPAGLNIRWPKDVAFMFLEIEYY